MRSREEIMNMLEAFDPCGSLRGAGALAGVSHHTVDRYVVKRDEGRLSGEGDPVVSPGDAGAAWPRGCCELRRMRQNSCGCAKRSTRSA